MIKIYENIGLLWNGHIDTSTEVGRAKDRSRRILLTSLSGVFVKILSIGIPLFTVRITYHYLGEEIYGLWSSVGSFFALFRFADLGLGNGLRTKLGYAYGTNDLKLSRELVSNTFFILLMVSVLLLLVFLAVYPFVSWSQLMNAKNPEVISLVGGVVLAIVVSQILKIPLTLVERTQMAIQEGYRSNYWKASAYLLSLLSIFLISRYNLGKITLIWASSMIIVIVSVLNMFVYFGYQKIAIRPTFRLLNFSTSKFLLKTGFSFFILAVLNAFGLALDNFIVGKVIGLSEAATYAIIFKISILIGGVTTMISSALWGANSDALAKDDFSWIKSNTKKMTRILTSLSIVASLVLIVISRPLIKVWLGSEIEFSIILVAGMCLMQVLFSAATSYFMVLNALGAIRIQIILFSIFIPISLILKIYLAGRFGIDVIPWIGSMLYLVCILIPIVFVTKKALNKYN